MELMCELEDFCPVLFARANGFELAFIGFRVLTL